MDMMNAIDKLAEIVNRLEKSTDNIVKGQLAKVFAAGTPRFFCAESPAFGHKASTVAILKRFIALNFINQGELVYENDDVLNSLRTLLPQIGPNTPPPPTINVTSGGKTVSVALTALSAVSTPTDFAICGGYDHSANIATLAGQLQVSWMVVVQPYTWELQNLQAYDVAYFSKATQKTLRLETLLPDIERMIYYRPQPAISQLEWQELAQLPGWAGRINAAQAVLQAVATNGSLFCPVYGISDDSSKTSYGAPPPVSVLFNLCGAIRYAQTNSGTSYQKGAVILVLAALKQASWTRLADNVIGQNVLGGAPNSLQAFVTQYTNPGGQAKILVRNDLTDPLQISTAINQLANDQVLILNIPGVPQDVFDLIYANASLPSIFEGAGTAPTVLNLGKPFFRVVDVLRVPYPVLPLNSGPNGPSTIAMQMVNKLKTLLAAWPSDPTQIPPAVLAQYFVDCYTPDSPMQKYFAEFATYLQQTQSHDKLFASLEAVLASRQFSENQVNLEITKLAAAGLAGGEARTGTVYENLVRTPPSGAPAPPDVGRTDGAAGRSSETQVAVSRPRTVGIAGGGDNVLDQVYQDLLSNTSDGVLNFVPGAFSTGPIYDLYSPISTGGECLITNTVITPPAGGQVVATGSTDSLLGLKSLAVKLTFTDGEFGLTSDLKLERPDLSWSLTNIPWFALKKPRFEIVRPNSQAQTSGTLGATIAAGSTVIDVSLGFPVVLEKWAFEAAFSGTQPSISNFFQLVGGINLAQMLPPPLNVFTDLAVQDLQILYDRSAQSIASFTVQVGTTQPWHLFGNITLGSLTIKALVTNPGDVTNRTTTFDISATFPLGPGTVAVDIAAPELVFSGTLLPPADTSKSVTIGDVVSLFLPQGQTVPISGDITQFEFQYNQPQTTWSVACNVNASWPVPPSPSTPIFTIDNLGFQIQSANNQITGVFSGSITILPKSANIGLSVTATYNGAGKGWVFDASQTSGEVDLGDLIHTYIDPSWNVGKLGINGLGLTIATADNSWVFTGKTAEPWSIPFLGATFTGKLTCGYNGSNSNASLLPAVRGSSALLGAAGGGCQGKGFFARVEADLSWQSIDLKGWFDYCPTVNSFGLTLTVADWGSLEGKVVGPDAKTGDYTATIGFGQSVTLGSIIENMVSWLTGSRFGLEAPWNFLDNINLSALSLVFVFNPKDSSRNHVSFAVNIGPIDLGFARIDTINIGYQSSGPNQGVQVTLGGSFPWNVGQGANGSTSTLGPWDASKPGSAPAPPGGGNKYFYLRMLAMGQHVTASCLPTSTTIQDAIACLATLPPTSPGKLPPIKFDAASSWLIGGDLGVLKLGDGSKTSTALATRADALAAADSGYMLTLQVVFNDPVLYGLRIALAGEPAKIFKGLDFQIMYRQISPTVGVYQAQITLPDAMRNLSIGAYSITLPVFAIAIYTNGDFLVDIGFPWNQDFSRSFTIQGIIYPGIPVLGSAGFYFGKLSSATSNQVPTITNGTFNPVIVFGFGLQIGFGKSIQYGVLSAGFSVTVFGIIEGVIAKFNPYPNQIAAGGGSSQVQGSYYFWLRGTVGILGKLFGTVDFAVVKADVNVEVKLMVQLTYESFVSISLTVLASVSVSVSISINLGIFSIKISFSFSMQLKETFTIDNHGTPPWTVAQGTTRGLLAAPADFRLRSHRAIAAAAAAAAAPMLAITANWANLLPAQTPLQLTGYVAPGLAMARNEWDSTQSLTDQVPCYVLGMFIDSVPPANEDAATSALKAAGAAPDTPFESVCKMVFRWAVASVQSGPMSASQIDGVVITEEQLDSLLSDVLCSTQANPTPIPASAIDPFMAGQFRMTAALPNSPQAPNATFFPVSPSLKLNIPAVQGGYPGYQYSFGGYNSISTTALQELREYFQQLAVQVSQEMNGAAAAIASADQQLSVASWMISDYFLLIARQMTQAARDGLRNYQYAIQSGDAPQTVLTFVVNGGFNGFTLFDLFTANQAHNLTAGKTLTVGVTYQTQPNDTFESIAGVTYGGLFTAAQLALLNAANTSILAVGAVINYPGLPAYTVQQNDSLISIAQNLGVPLNYIVINTTVTTQPNLLAAQQVLAVPEVTYQALASDTFTSIATTGLYSGRFKDLALATLNAGLPILTGGTKVTYSGKTYVVQPQDSLGDVANYFKAALPDFLSNSGVLGQAGLLSPVALLNLPAFAYTTAQGDSLQSVAAFFATTVEVLAAQASNGTVADLFDASATPNLNLPHLPQFQVGLLIAEAQRALALQHLSGMASRYYMHGLRLPTTGIVPGANGMWVVSNGGQLTLPPAAGLYALSGQQVPLPAQNLASFTMTVDATAGPSWLTFQSSGKTGPTLQIALSTTDVTSITNVQTYATANRLNTGLTELGAGQMYQSDLAKYPLVSSLIWQSSGPVTLPYGTAPAGAVTPRIWILPDAMVNLPDPTTRAINPRFRVGLARYDEASGATVDSPVSYYGWASTVNFTVKGVPAVSGSPASADTYEIIGASGDDIILLQRLVEQAQGDDGLFASLAIGYQPSQSGPATQGVQTDPEGSVTTGIAQVNLSTVTHPPTAAARVAAVGAPPPAPGLLNPPSEFVRLLWEASITASGGFYLYYYNTAGQTGLPDRIFNDKREAVITLIVLYHPETANAANRLCSYMNAVAIGDPIDATNSVVFAEADPPANPYPQIPSSSASLGDLAYQYFCDLGDLAQANAALKLAAGNSIAVNHGTFQAPLAGMSLASIAQQFGVTVAQIQAVNPAPLPDPLVFPGAIRLPAITVASASNANTASLAAISGAYGENVAALAAENSTVAGIFATGQSVTITGGPSGRAATVPPGVQSVAAVRPVPPAVPNDPTASGYAQDFLLNAFSLLNYQIASNGFFQSSNLGLPAGPTTGPATESAQKIQVPRLLAAGDNWEYLQSLPYPKFVVPPTHIDLALPDPSQSPYAGVGYLLQVAFDWQDYYGNTLVTTLTDPQNGDSGPLNEPPLLTGYTDPLVGVSQWPSVSAAWQVLPTATPGTATLEVLLSFDNTRYEGLLVASAGAATTVTAQFTQPLNPALAGQVANYSLGSGVTIQTAVPSQDGLTVQLTLAAALAPGQYTLTVTGLQTTAQAAVEGQATFNFPDDPGQRTSTLQQNAGKDLQVYGQFFYQFFDPNGMAFSVASTLLAGVGGNPGQVPLGSQAVASLGNWLFNNTNSLYKFIQDRSKFGTTVADPAPQQPIDFQISGTQVNQAQLFELSLSFIMQRTGGAVLPDLEATPGIRTVSTAVAPLFAQVDGEEKTVGLTAFAANFEQALQQPGSYRLKVATGVDRTEVSSATNGGALWAVRVGLVASQAISYTVNDQNSPTLFAPQPISNQLQTRPNIQIYDYTTGQGISKQPTRTLNFTGIDMDVWGRQFFAAIDGVLTPQFTAPAQIVGHYKNTDYLGQILQRKDALAGIARLWMIPSFDGVTADPSAVQEAFRQQLLSRLSNAYSTQAGIEFHAAVNANIVDPASDQPPRLYGTIEQTPGTGSNTVSLTSPKLTLATSQSQPLAFLLIAPEVVTGADGQVVPSLNLDLTYNPVNIEHQISSVPTIKGYVTSSWLSFVIFDSPWPLDGGLGAFPVPMPLRSYPAPPVMTGQTGAATSPGSTTLSQLTQWTYDLTYTLPFHYPQDRVYCDIEFNVENQLGMLAGFLDAFPQLAEFITVFPAVNNDLTGILAGIDATTDPVADKTKIDNAAIALASFEKLVADVVTAAGEVPLMVRKPPRTMVGDPDLSYKFYIEECSVDLPNAPGSLLVSLVGAPPAGIGAPQVLISPEEWDAIPYSGQNCEQEDCDGKNRFCFIYRQAGSTTNYLSASVGQAIPARQVVLSGMDILQRQDALATLYIKRNEKLAGRKMAEPFVYTTPDVQFANPLNPTLDSQQPVSIPSVGSGQPVTRPLNGQLTNLFAALLANNQEPELTFQVEVTYGYSLNAALTQVTLPIFFQPPLTVTISGTGAGTLTQMLSDWSAAIQTWFQQNLPNTTNGVLGFDLVIMSNLTIHPMPLLRLRELELPIQYVQPALP